MKRLYGLSVPCSSDEYDVRPVRSVQLAFDEMHTSAPALFLVDMPDVYGC